MTEYHLQVQVIGQAVVFVEIHSHGEGTGLELGNRFMSAVCGEVKIRSLNTSKVCADVNMVSTLTLANSAS